MDTTQLGSSRSSSSKDEKMLLSPTNFRLLLLSDLHQIRFLHKPFLLGSRLLMQRDGKSSHIGLVLHISFQRPLPQFQSKLAKPTSESAYSYEPVSYILCNHIWGYFFTCEFGILLYMVQFHKDGNVLFLCSINILKLRSGGCWMNIYIPKLDRRDSFYCFLVLWISNHFLPLTGLFQFAISNF